jgi:hypothetical protein
MRVKRTTLVFMLDYSILVDREAEPSDPEAEEPPIICNSTHAGREIDNKQLMLIGSGDRKSTTRRGNESKLPKRSHGIA